VLQTLHVRKIAALLDRSRCHGRHHLWTCKPLARNPDRPAALGRPVRESGWVTYRMHDRANVARVVALFRLNYERPWWERTPELPVTDDVRTCRSRSSARKGRSDPNGQLLTTRFLLPLDLGDPCAASRTKNRRPASNHANPALRADAVKVRSADVCGRRSEGTRP
jgi:hypothetical protein